MKKQIFKEFTRTFDEFMRELETERPDGSCECYATQCNQCGLRCEIYGNAEGYGEPKKHAVDKLIARIDGRDRTWKK